MKQAVRCMRAAAAGGIEVIEPFSYGIEDLTSTLGADEIIVQTAFVGINFIDTYHRSGLYPPPRPFPCTLGNEASGTVLQAGAEALNVNPKISIGSKVAFFSSLSGAYATHIKVKAIDAFPIPEGVNEDVAAATMLQGCTAHYLCDSCHPVKEGTIVLIHAAAGGTGLLLSQMCKIKGATVIGTCGSEEKKELALTFGKCDHVINYTANPEWWTAVRELAPKGVDVVFDGVGKSTFLKGLEVLRKRGDMVTFGNASGAVEPIAPLLLTKFGSLRLQRPKLEAFASHDDGEIEGRVSEIFGWISEKKLDVRVGKEFPLEEAASAQTFLEGRSSTGKVVLKASE